ncbi:hypothetical protein EC988_001775 [Linderina pennispora]|nr:hypothetical protein EC988_001775 [Linderina pennispora]
MARRLDEADQQDQMMNAFRLFKPGSGREGITFEDLKQIASHLGESIPDEELHEMINIADTQDTGQVSFEDFSRIMLKTGLF